MAKATVTRLFIGAVTAVIAGALLVLAAVVVALAGGVVKFGGSDHVSVEAGVLAWSAAGVAAAGLLAIAAGVVAAVVSWVGALLNTFQLEDKTWFVVLLAGGVFSLGIIVMIAYVLAGPDAPRKGAPLLNGAAL